MRRTTVRRWKNIGRIGLGSATIAGNAYVIGKTLGLGKVASVGLIKYRATPWIRFATHFPRVVRYGRLATAVHSIGEGAGGMRWGAKLIQRGYRGLRGTVHEFHGNQYVKIPSRGQARPIRRASQGMGLRGSSRRRVR